MLFKTSKVQYIRQKIGKKSFARDVWVTQLPTMYTSYASFDVRFVSVVVDVSFMPRNVLKLTCLEYSIKEYFCLKIKKNRQLRVTFCKDFQ